MIKEWLDKLTDRYTHDPNSNIGKIIAIISSELDDLTGTINTVESWRDLQQARGSTLDLIGAQFDQRRGDASSDDVYRILIRGKISQSMSDGTTNKIIQSLSHTFDCDPKEIGVRSANEYGMDEPGAVVIELSPPTILGNVDMPQSDFRSIIEKVVAAGIMIYWDLITNFNVGIETAEIKGSSVIGYCGEIGCGGGPYIFGAGKIIEDSVSVDSQSAKGVAQWPVIAAVIPIPENRLGVSRSAAVAADTAGASGLHVYIFSGTRSTGDDS